MIAKDSVARDGFLPVTLYVSEGSVGKSSQTFFPMIRKCNGEEEFLLATMYDYTNIRFREGKRLSENFQCCDCLIGDIDNSHSDDASEWLWPEDVAERFHGVPLYIQYSRNHMKVKTPGKEPRPKFHLVVPITTVNTPDEYAYIWRQLKALVPEIDGATKDLARFMFGCGPTNKGEFFPGDINFTEFCEINEIEPVEEEYSMSSSNRTNYSSYNNNAIDWLDVGLMYDGERTRKLLSYGVKLYYKYRGDPNRDNLVWDRLACLANEHCVPPYPLKELNNVFRSAKKYAEKDRCKILQMFNSFEDDE